MAQARVTSAVLQGVVFKLDGEYFTIGREPDNTIQLAHTSISKHHAMLTIDKDDFKLWDLHSTNGLVVNGEKTVLRHLENGDRILLGEIELLFELNGSAPKVTTPIPARKRETQLLTIAPPSSPPSPKPIPPAPPPPAVVVATSLANIPATAASTSTLEKTETKTTRPGPLFRLFGRRQKHPQSEPAPPDKPATTTALQKPTSPVPTPPATIVPKRSGKRLAVFAVVLVLGLLLLRIGYSTGVPSLKFLGFVSAITGFIALVFTFRFGSIIAPPRS